MEIFDVHRRDIFDFDTYMDLKKPGFGGPNSAKQLRDSSGKKVNKNPKLDGYQHTVERHKAFSNQVFDPTYKAMSNDLVYKQEKKKPLNYGDPYITGIPVVNAGDYQKMDENRTLSFSDFVNEEKKAHAPKKCKCKNKSKHNADCGCGDKKKKMNESHFKDDFFYKNDPDEYDDYESNDFGLNPSDEDFELEDRKMQHSNSEPEEEEEFTDDEYTTDFEDNDLDTDSNDSEEEFKDEYEAPEEKEEDWEEKGPSKKDIQEIENLLKGYENGDEDDEDDDRMPEDY